jgi:hypothetical protein
MTQNKGPTLPRVALLGSWLQLGQSSTDVPLRELLQRSRLDEIQTVVVFLDLHQNASDDSLIFRWTILLGETSLCG